MEEATDGRWRPHRVRELSRFERLWFAGVLLAVVAMAAVLLWRLHTDGWTQVGDEANQVHGAQRTFRERPLLGDFNTANQYGNPSSRHAGPMPWYLLAPWVRVLGPQLGGWLGAVVLNITSLVVATWLAFRAGGTRSSAVALLALLIAFATTLAGSFASAFFQHLPILPLAVCLLGSWALARGDAVAALPVVVSGSFVIQSATVPAPVVLAAMGTATVLAARALRADRPLGTRRSAWLAVGVGSGIAVWAPPLWDQIAGTGNLGLLARVEIPHAGPSGIGHLGELLVDAARPLAVLALVVVALALATRPRRLTPQPHLTAVVVATLVGAAVQMMLLPADDVESTHTLWVPIVAALVVVLLAAVSLPDRELGRTGPLAASIGAVLVVLTISQPLAEPGNVPIQDRVAMGAVDAMLPDVLDAVPPGAVQVNYRGSWLAGRTAQALMPHLEDAGRPGSLAMGAIVAFDGPTLVVLPSEPTPWQRGRTVASYQPPRTGLVDADFEEAVDRWARENGPLELRVQAGTILVNLVDGRAEQLCIDDLLEDPDRILDLGPDLAARLFGVELVASPALPPELHAQVNPWQAEQPTTILEISAPDGSPGDLAFSRDSC